MRISQETGSYSVQCKKFSICGKVFPSSALNETQRLFNVYCEWSEVFEKVKARVTGTRNVNGTGCIRICSMNIDLGK